ncbi:MAG TPA: chemotaxis protein CheB [Pyrinomonadaceae bacterium]
MGFEIVVVGTSTGGLKAMQTLLSSLPEDFPLAVVIVQHREAKAEVGLCEYLNRHSNLIVSEPEDKEEILPGRVYLAPSDYHLLIEKRAFALSTDPPVSFARPSIDVLFESAADEYGKAVIGVILTGVKHDGARGLARIKSRGGFVLIEDPKTATCREMPQAAMDHTPVDRVLPLEEIAPLLQELTVSRAVSYGV